MPLFSEELRKEIDERKVKLGGCCVTENDPAYYCNDCKTDLYTVLN
jgi:hypothetical protein